jgi:hypothetical protein
VPIFSKEKKLCPTNCPFCNPSRFLKTSVKRKVFERSQIRIGGTGHSKRDLFVRSSMTIDDNVDRYRAILRYLVQNARFHIPVDGNLSISLNSRIIDL